METSQIGSLSSAVVNSGPGTSLIIKEEVDDSAKVIETDTSIIEFEFLQTDESASSDHEFLQTDGSTVTDPDLRCQSETPESDSEEVLDKIFDAATSGNSREISKLIFSGFSNSDRTKSILKNRSKKSAETHALNSERLLDSVKDIACARSNTNSTKRKIENGHASERPVKVTVRDSNRLVNFQNIKNLTGVPVSQSSSVQSARAQTKAPPQKNLIDYSVLTRALTKTLESKLTGQENDVKIVIFCNNKPIQSFSVRGNSGEKSLTENKRVVSEPATPIRSKINEKLRNKLKSSAISNKEDVSKPDTESDKNHDVDECEEDNDNELVIDESELEGKKAAEKDKSEIINETLNAKTENIQCELCGKGFKLRRYLYRHKVRVHSGENTPTGKPNVIDTENNNNVDVEGVEGTTVEEFDPCKVKDEPLSDSEEELGYKYIKSLFDKEKLQEIFDQHSSGSGSRARDSTPKDIERSILKSSELPLTKSGKIEPVFVCEHCGKFYRARKTLREHFQREHKTEGETEPLYIYIAGDKYQCSICFNNFHSAGDLLAHTKIHTGELRSSCKICGKVYSSVHVLRRHIDNIHSEVRPRPFQCELCDYAASNKWHLKEHYRRHTGEQPYTCPICHKSFSHQGTMNRHCKTLHKFDAAASKVCSQIENTLSSCDSPPAELDIDVSCHELDSLDDIVSPAISGSLSPTVETEHSSSVSSAATGSNAESSDPVVKIEQGLENTDVDVE